MGSIFGNLAGGKWLLLLPACAISFGIIWLTAATSEAGPSCEPIGQPAQPPEQTVSSPDGLPLGGAQPEVTQFFKDGSYQVTRCDDDGEIQLQQLVGPVPVPGGKTVPLPLAEFRRVNGLLQGAIPTFPDPSDPVAARNWREYGDQARAAVVPPTEGVVP